MNIGILNCFKYNLAYYYLGFLCLLKRMMCVVRVVVVFWLAHLTCSILILVWRSFWYHWRLIIVIIVLLSLITSWLYFVVIVVLLPVILILVNLILVLVRLFLLQILILSFLTTDLRNILFDLWLLIFHAVIFLQNTINYRVKNNQDSKCYGVPHLTLRLVAIQGVLAAKMLQHNEDLDP